MTIFNGYVKSPEGNSITGRLPSAKTLSVQSGAGRNRQVGLAISLSRTNGGYELKPM